MPEEFERAQSALLAEYGVSCTERRVRLRDPALSAHLLDTGEGPPTVFIDGSGMSAATSAPLLAGPSRHANAALESGDVESLPEPAHPEPWTRPIRTAGSWPPGKLVSPPAPANYVDHPRARRYPRHPAAPVTLPAVALAARAPVIGPGQPTSRHYDRAKTNITRRWARNDPDRAVRGRSGPRSAPRQRRLTERWSGAHIRRLGAHRQAPQDARAPQQARPRSLATSA